MLLLTRALGANRPAHNILAECRPEPLDMQAVNSVPLFNDSEAFCSEASPMSRPNNRYPTNHDLDQEHGEALA